MILLSLTSSLLKEKISQDICRTTSKHLLLFWEHWPRKSPKKPNTGISSPFTRPNRALRGSVWWPKKQDTFHPSLFLSLYDVTFFMQNSVLNKTRIWGEKCEREMSLYRRVQFSSPGPLELEAMKIGEIEPFARQYYIYSLPVLSFCPIWRLWPKNWVEFLSQFPRLGSSTHPTSYTEVAKSGGSKRSIV